MANERVTRDIIINYTESNAEVVKDTIKTIDRMIQNRQLNRYWKDQNALINDVTSSYEKYNKTLNKMDATELVKSFNALKALSGIKELDISQLLPNFDKVEGKVKELIKSIDLNEAFGVDAFSSAFKVFDMLKAGGIDLQDFFKRFDLDIDTQNLQKSLRLAEKEIQRVKNELVEKDMKIDSLVSGSGFEKQEAELESLRNKLKEVYESAEMTFNSFLYANNIDPYSQDGLYKYFQKIKDGAWTAEQAISEFKAKETHLLQESYNKSGGLFNLQQVQEFEGKLESVLNRVEEISRQMNDIIENGVMTKAMQNLSVDDTISQSQRDLFANVLKDEEALSSIAGVLKKIIDESVTLQGLNNKTFDEEQFNRLLILFENIESSLSSMKAVFVDVGDGEEFSPLLKMINNVQESIEKLSTSVKGIGLNMNIDVGSDKELETQFQDKVSKALIAYQRLFDHIKMSGVGGSVINDAFFNFDLNHFDTTIGKVKALQQFIDKTRDDAKALYGGQDVLKQDTDAKFWNQASAALAQIKIVEKRIKASTDTSPLENLFGKTDLTEVVTQLNLIVDKLGEISTTASEFKNVFANGFNVSASVEEIEKLTSRVKELEDELSKIKMPTSTSPVETNISSPIKDTFQGDKIEQATTSAKELDKTLEQVNVPKESFDDVIAKFNIIEDKAKNIVKITKDMHQDSNGKHIESYNITYKDGSNESYGENSNPQLLRGKDVLYDAKEQENKKLEEQKRIYKELNNEIDRYATVSKRIANGKALSSDEEELAKLQSRIEELQNEPILSKEQLEASQLRLEKLEATLEDIQEITRNNNIDSMQSEIDAYNKRYNNLNIKPSDENRSADYQKAIDNYKTSIGELETFLDRLRTSSAPITEEIEKQWNEITLKVDKASDAVKAFSAAEKGSDEDARMKEIDKLTKYLEPNTRISKKARQELEHYLDILKSGDPSVNVKKIHTEWTRVAVAERAAGREGKKFWDIITDKALYGQAAQLAGYYLSLTDFIRYGQEGIQIVRELDTALTEMRKVSDETVSSLERFQGISFDLADDVGTTGKQIQDSTASWMRLGEAMSEASESAQVSNILLNVSEFESIDEATESLVAMSAAYKDLEKIEIVDVLNKIGNEYSISTDGIATALQDSASALVTANNDLNEAVALITAGNAVTQDPNSVGAGMRTISLRLVGTEEAKAELEKLGEDVSDMVITSSKVRETIMNATKAASKDGKGFDILDANGNYKSTYEIMQGLADLYDEIVAKDKELGTNNLNLLLETIAGKNRANIAASILQNGDMLRSVYEDAQNSDGSAQEELDKYLESIDGKMAKLENQAQEFWYKLIDSDTIKNGITLLTELLGLATDFVDTFGALGTAGVGIGAVLGAKDLG